MIFCSLSIIVFDDYKKSKEIKKKINKEMLIMKQNDYEDRLRHILNYVKNVFEGDDPEDYLQAVFPKIWNIYLINYIDRTVKNGGFRLLLWNTQEKFNDEMFNSFKDVGAVEFDETFKKILKRFNKDINEKNRFLQNDFSDAKSKNFRDSLRRITWDFLDKVDSDKNIKDLQTRLKDYIESNLNDISIELAKLRVDAS